MNPPICPYCGRRSVYHRTSHHLYHGRDYGPVFECTPCGAWVGCCPDSQLAKGTLANADLRKARKAAHKAFDPMWHGVRVAVTGDGIAQYARLMLDRQAKRGAAYRWLAGELGLPVEKCHIALFDLEQCRRVVEVCKANQGRDHTDED